MGQNSFNPGVLNNSSSSIGSNDESLNIDDLIKKIDSKIAELEEEDKKDNEAKDNEEVASSKKLVEDIMNDNNIKEDNNIHSSDVIMSPNKIDFSSFELPEEKKSDNNEIKPDIMDDFLEDLSIDDNEDDTVINTSNTINNNEENKDVTNVVNEAKEQKDDLYVNKEEVDKIMKEKEPDDFFDEFFE